MTNISPPKGHLEDDFPFFKLGYVGSLKEGRYDYDLILRPKSGFIETIHTVDGRNPAPVDRYFIPLFTRFYTSQVVK